MAFLNREGKHVRAPQPDLILMDLNLPKMGGREALALIKMDDRLKVIPVIVLSSSDVEADVLQSYQSHANFYVKKPTQWDAFDEIIKSIGSILLMGARLPQPI